MSESQALAPGLAPPPGGRLSSEREKRGWTVIDTAERLHLEPVVVEALEANDFAKLGPAVFAKGHLKQYAVLLGLPPAELVAAYDELLRKPGVVAAPLVAGDDSRTPFPAVTSASWRARGSKMPGWSRAMVGVLLLAIVAGALAWWQPWRRHARMVANSQGAASPASIEQQPVPVTPIVESAAPPMAVAASADPAGSAAAPSPAAPPLAAAGKVRLRMSFSADSTVEVRDAAGATVYRGRGRANSVKVVSGMAPLSVVLGSASGVQLEINRHAVAIGSQFLRGDVARFEAGADGVLRRAPHP